jgi:phospholipid/cholesterol/gamma-HCH transport system permease protein
MSTFFIIIGERTLFYLRDMGRMVIFLASFLRQAFYPPFRLRNIVKEMHFIGVRSLFVIVLTATFTGMVLGLQGIYTLRKFGSEGLLGSAVALSIIRELGPVFTAIMVTARAGSAMAAELGSMRITEQIDALDVMTINPIKYLVVPRILAGILVMPLLVAIFDVLGITGGYLVGVKMMGVNKGSFFQSMQSDVVFKDIYSGFIKSVVFGLTLTWTCCYKGYYPGHGASGVSRATTEAVVLSAILILAWDFFLTSILL